jgi:hypothetical protein
LAKRPGANPDKMGAKSRKSLIQIRTKGCDREEENGLCDTQEVVSSNFKLQRALLICRPRDFAVFRFFEATFEGFWPSPDKKSKKFGLRPDAIRTKLPTKRPDKKLPRLSGSGLF